MTWPPDRLSDPLLQGLYSNCRNDSIRLLLMDKVSETVISLTLPDFTDAPPSLTVSPFRDRARELSCPRSCFQTCEFCDRDVRMLAIRKSEPDGPSGCELPLGKLVLDPCL